MKRSVIFKSLSIAMVALAFWGCSSRQIVQKSGNDVYDDLYAQVGETSPIIVVNKVDRYSSLNQNPENSNDNRAYSDDKNSSNEYYAEQGIDSRDYQRGTTDRPGFGDYTDGYRDGINDSRFNWGNSWNNGFGGFNRFGWNNFNNWNNPGLSIIIGGGNRWRNNWGMNSWGWNDPFYANNGWGNSWNNFGYGGFNDPWGFNNFYGNGFYGGGGGWLNQPRYIINNNYYANNNNSNIGADRATRNYGPRNSGRNSAAYNDKFDNTVKPRPSADPNMRKGTVYSDPTNAASGVGSGGGYSARPRGGYGGGNTSATNGNTQVNSNTPNNSRGSDTYSARPRGGYINPNTGSGTSQTATNSNSNARPSAAPANDNNVYYARPSRSTTTPNYTPSTGGSNNSSGNYSRGADNSSSSSPSRSSWNSGSSSSGSSSSSWGGSSGSSSSGGGSRGSSGGGSSSGGSGGGGGSRGPR